MKKDRHIRVPDAVVARCDLSPGARLLYGVLQSYCVRSSTCWPSQETLAERLGGVCERTVKRWTDELRRAGLVDTERRRRASLRYTITPDRAVTPSPPQERTRVSGQDKPKTGQEEHPDQTDVSAPPDRAVRGSHSVSHTGNHSKGKRGAHKAPPDPRVRPFIDFFCTAYREATGRDYIVCNGKDGLTVKRLLKRLDSVEVCGLAALKRATRNMLADDWGRESASVGLLSAQINKWRGDGRAQNRAGRFTPAAAGADYDLVTTRFAEDKAQ